ncbi:unnamed protein product, partial [Candidula unifasciata]
SLDVIVVHSSESPEQANQSLSDHKGDQREDTDRALPVSGNLQPPASASSIRRSVRIQGLQNSNIFDLISDSVTNDEYSNLFSKPDSNQIEDPNTKAGNSDNLKRNTESKNEGNDNLNLQISEDTSNFTSDVCEASRDTTNVGRLKFLSSSRDGQKNVDSPFVMFRTKQPAECPVSLSQNTASISSPRRVSLRKVRSQDNIPLSRLVKGGEVSQGAVSPKDTKLPRRVPLKKVNEQESEPAPENFTHETLPKSDDCSASCNVNTADQPTDYFSIVADENDDSDSCANVSCTLVEDTQSPFKLKQHVQEVGHMITETPLKSDSSTSPPVRAASARKLFTDSDTASLTPTPIVSTDQAVESKAGDVDTNGKSLLFETMEMPSSQGFDIACDNSTHHTDHKAIQPSSSASGNECIEGAVCASEAPDAMHPGSENLFSGTDAFSAPIDMMMQTMSSEVDHLETVSEMTNSDESHKTSSMSTDEHQQKETASSESDFVCLQPTLADDAQSCTPNKRKQGTPKRMSLMKGSRTSRRHRQVKGSPCCKGLKPSSNSKSKPAKSNSSTSVTSQNSSTVIELPSSVGDAFVLLSPVETEDSDEVFTKISDNGKALQEIGEVTPDIKSPKSNPERRHSAVKRMGKRKLENTGVSKPLAPNKLRRLESADSDNSNSACEIKKHVSSGATVKAKLASPVDKKKSVHKNLSKLGKRKYNKLGIFPRDGQSSPTIKTESQVDSGSKHTDDEDELPLSYLKKYKENDCGDTNGDGNNQVEGKSADIDIQKSDSADSVVYLQADISVIDVDVNRAQQQALVESSVLSDSENVELSAELMEKGSSVECSSSLSPASVSQKLPQAGQVMISPEAESYEPEIKTIPVIDNLVCMETVDEGITDEKTVDCNPLEDSQNSEKISSEELVILDQPQTEVEVTVGDIKQTHLDEDTSELQDMAKLQDTTKVNTSELQDIAKLQDTTKICSDSLDPAEEDISGSSREKDFGTQVQLANQRSPQKSACVHSWSPTRSPSCSILKKGTETPPGGKNRRVSFAEPVVNGESPVRERCGEFVPTSPLISAQISSPGQKASLINKLQGRSPRYRNRLESSKRQEPPSSRLMRRIVSPQTQLSFRPTQESQLNNSEPIFPDLVNCTNPLDDVLPQLTSSLWYRGLCQLMKGRNVNTIGDLSSLTEVQIDQLPIRHPKVESVRSTLTAYMMQHGLGKTVNSSEDSYKSPRSKGSIVEQEVTPASIDDDEVQVHPSADEDLKQFSPILGKFSDAAAEPSTTEDSSLQNHSPSQMLSDLKNMAKTCSASVLKQASIAELFEIHQTLNVLFTNVVEEMKTRQPMA